MYENSVAKTGLKQALLTNKAVQIAEIVALFLIALIVIKGLAPLAGENPLARQGTVWIANVLMMVFVWLGLRARGQGWEHFGLDFQNPGGREIFRKLWKSLIVFVAAVAAFVLGSIIMANITGIPEQADFSGYNYLKGNLPMLILALLGVYIVSSFGEELIYRAFLINRISEIGGSTKWAIRIAVLISAIIFGLVHYDWGAMGVVQTGFMGLALAVAYLVLKRDLWIPILAHIYIDTILLVQMYFGA